MANMIMVVSPQIKEIQERFLHSKTELTYGHKIITNKTKESLEQDLKKEIIFSENYSEANNLILKQYYSRDNDGRYTVNNNKIKSYSLKAIVEETGLENENERFKNILSSYGFAPDNREFHLNMFKKHFSQNLFNDLQGRMYLFEWLKPFENLDKYYITPYTTHTTKTFKEHKIVCTSEEYETQANSPMNKLYEQLYEKYLKK